MKQAVEDSIQDAKKSRETAKRAKEVEEMEAAMMKAMGHSLYQAYLMNSGLDNTSPMGSEAWGKQIKMMVGEFGPALKEMGLLD